MKKLTMYRIQFLKGNVILKGNCFSVYTRTRRILMNDPQYGMHNYKGKLKIVVHTSCTSMSIEISS